MEVSKIEYIKENIYIAPQVQPVRPALPTRHPSLILNDKQYESGTTFQCGCSGGICIKEGAHWIGPNGEVNATSSDSTATEVHHFKTLIHDSVGRQL
jgi:hypothetical protein